MAKKNLSALMSGIIGDTSPSLSKNQLEKPADPAVSEDTTASDNTPRRGRPVKNKEPKSFFTFSAPDDLLNRLKYVCFVDGTTQKDILIEALSDYLSKWEQENGPIRLPKKKSKG